MAIGLRRAGFAGLIAAWLGFALPASVAMIAFAYLLPKIDPTWGDGMLHGLKIAAAAVVAQALVGMARALAWRGGLVHRSISCGVRADLSTLLAGRRAKALGRRI